MNIREATSIHRDVRQKARAFLSKSFPRVLRTSLFYAVMPGLSAVNALVGLLLPLILGPITFGRYAIVVTLFQYGLVFDLGLAQLIDRRVPSLMVESRTEALHRFVGAVLWLRVYIAGTTFVCGGLIMSWLAHRDMLPFNFWAGMLSLVAGLFFMLSLGPGSVYRASSQRQTFGRINIAMMVILATARPLGVLAGGVIGCFAALAILYGGLAVVVQAMMPLKLHLRPNAGKGLSLLRQAVPLFITSFIWAFYMTANRWVVSMLAPDIILGQFAFGSNIVYLLVGAIGAMSQFYYPRIVAQFANGPSLALSRTIMRDFSLLLAGTTLMTATGLFIGPFLISTFYPEFAGNGNAVQILLLAVPSLVVASWLMPLSLSTAARPWIDGLIYPLALLILVVVTHSGYRIAGAEGAAYGFVLSALPLLALQLVSLRTTRLLALLDLLLLLAAAAMATGLLWLLV